MSAARVALLGGSSAFTPALAAALAARRDDLPELSVALYGRRAARAELVARVSNEHARAAGAPHAYHGTTSLEAALEGARVVVLQVRVGGWAGRAYDESFPLTAGVPGDETIGPGGLAAGVRAAPTVRALAAQVVARTEHAWLVQMSNPLGILLAVLSDVPGLRAFGLCELPGVVLRRALAAAGLGDAGGLEVDYAGLNHQGWFTRVARAGRPVAGVATPLPLPYLELYSARAQRAAQLRARARTRGAELAALDAELFACYARGAGAALPAALARRATPWYEEALAPVLAALLGGPACEAYVSEANRGHLPFLPPDAIVEKRARVARGGPSAPRLAQPVPAQIAAFLARVAAFEALAAAAARRPDEPLVRAALAAHPFDLAQEDVALLARGVLRAQEVSA